jgi:hypothetical protein
MERQLVVWAVSRSRPQARPSPSGAGSERDQPLYQGLMTGEIQPHLAEIYDTEVSRETISKIAD